MDQFILFGDSITQQSFTTESNRGYFGPALTDYYLRRLDIINRGFSGYNTSQALKILPKFMPSPQQARVRFLTVFFGANDARLPNTPGGPSQHVPLEEYKENLRRIVTHESVKAHEGVRVILVTPPPVEERKLVDSDYEKHGIDSHESGLRRTAETTKKYAEAVLDLGYESSLPVLDLWTIMMKRTGYCISGAAGELLPGSLEAEPSQVLQTYLSDGLHFNRSAYELLFEELISLIEKRWPNQSQSKLPFVLPAWDDEEAWKDGKEIEARTML